MMPKPVGVVKSVTTTASSGLSITVEIDKHIDKIKKQCAGKLSTLVTGQNNAWSGYSMPTPLTLNKYIDECIQAYDGDDWKEALQDVLKRRAEAKENAISLQKVILVEEHIKAIEDLLK